MIKQFQDAEMRESGIIYAANLEVIQEMYATDPALAGELAISIMELTLKGTISSDNPMIGWLLSNLKKSVAKSKEKYDKKVANTETKKLERLTKIAELYNQGLKQKDIAKILNKAASTISEDMATIRTEYPELLNEKFGKFGNFGTYTDTETYTDTYTETFT